MLVKKCFLLLVFAVILIAYVFYDLELSFRKRDAPSPKGYTSKAAESAHSTNTSQTKFLYLFQTEECLPNLLLHPDYYGNSTLCRCMVIVLSYKSPCSDNRHAHVYYVFEKTSWAGGRNSLYQLAKAQNLHRILYFIFSDDDIQLHFNRYTPNALKSQKPARLYENFLLDYEPAVGFVDYPDWGVREMLSMQRKLNCAADFTPLHISQVYFDAIFNGFHRDAIDYLFPYPTKYEQDCWWHSQKYIIMGTEFLFRGQAVMYTPVVVMNPAHRGYPRKCKEGDTWNRVWVEFTHEVINKIPQPFKAEKMVADFKENPLKYIKETPLTVCLKVPPHHPIEPYGHFKYFPWNQTFPN